MKTYFALFLIATFASLTLTPLLRRFAERYQLVDEPRDDRRLHSKPMPRLGGIAIFAAVVIALSGLLFVHNLLTEALWFYIREIRNFLICGTLVLILGVYDDLRGTNAKVKFVVLGAIACLFYALGSRITGLSIPMFGTVGLPAVVGFLVTIVWIVGIANAFNLIDGVDGLATGSALFSSLVLLTVSLMQGRVTVAVVSLVLSGALVGFLRYNFNPASIFLGDSGSLFVGFTLAALSLQGAQKASTAVAVAIPILAFGLPVVDTTVAIARRFVSRKPIFQGDREHIHHMLLARGWSQRRVALVLYGVSAILGLLAMLFVTSANSLTAVVLFVVGAAVVIAVGKLRYHEVDELRASVKRTIGDRRARAANNVHLRRACRNVSASINLNGLCTSAIEILELGDFACAIMRLNCGDRIKLTDLTAPENGPRPQYNAEEGSVEWIWTHPEFSQEDVVGSDRFWILRLPVANRSASFGYLNLYRQFDVDGLPFNVNYLTTIFQPAVTEAAERILQAWADESEPIQLVASVG